MHKLLKIPADQKDNTVFLSDLHRNHDRDFILDPRWSAFSAKEKSEYSDWDVKRHIEWQDNQWQEKFDENTIVFNLGDSHFADPEGEEFERFSKLLCKEHYYLWGNHNSGAWKTYNRARVGWFQKHFGGNSNFEVSMKNIHLYPEIYPLKYNNITFMGNQMVVRFGKKEITLSHFSHRVWDHVGHGAWNLHGHSHGSDSERNVDSLVGKSLDVGVENAIKYDDKMFFTYREIESIMKTKSIRAVDHHDNNTNPSR